ncbi:hypothetical protein [Perlabentimonas gracilis]|uniref:hypothetical protein n=1 Tax=Perlabentimonas gracilis TaxID=2715279 RepID=UPI00140CD518|nr:hypothetical protein [Perlabentimonas gracilis]
MMKIQTLQLLVILVLTGFTCGCICHTPEEKAIDDTLNETVDLYIFNTVHLQDSILSIDELKNSYDYISLIYLLNECAPCYERYIDWHKKMDNIKQQDNHTALFIVEGLNYSNFLDEINSIEPISNKFYVIMDPNRLFFMANPNIPKWIIDKSLLIDKEFKVRMVGEPWADKKKTKQFRKICKKTDKEKTVH